MRDVLIAFFASVLLSSCFWQQPIEPSVRKGHESRSTIVLQGHVVTPQEVVENGWIVIEGGLIRSISKDQPIVPGAVVLQTSELVFPGFVDLHNHPLYNIFGRWSPGRLFDNRYQWRDDNAYKTAIQSPYRKLLPNHFCDLVAFTELKALIGGTTSIVGLSAPSGRQMPKCITGMVRNLDWYTGFYGSDLGRERIRSYIGITSRDMNAARVQEIKRLLGSGQIDALAIHIAEGKRSDGQSQSEFGLLRSKGLLGPSTIIVHGIALTPNDFQLVAGAGAGLVWSPRSNTELYGETMDVLAALRSGVSVAIAPDWSPTGSSNMLAELRYAAQLNRQQLGNQLTAKQLFEMATVVPARMVKLEKKIGALMPGMHADLFLVPGEATAAYDALLSIEPETVSLVIINGVPTYGKAHFLSKLVPQSIEAISVCEAERALNPAAITEKFGSVVARLLRAVKELGVEAGPLAECES